MLQFKQIDEGLQLSGPALIFVEGKHTDSKKRDHLFDVNRIQRIVENTNNFIRKGGRVPFQRDHKKEQAFNLGDIDGEFYCAPITPDKLPDPRYKHLIGKVGVFVDNLVAKGQEAVTAIKEGRIRTLSAGIDPITESFVEVSATPIPAIIGPSLMFSRDGNIYEEDNFLLFESSPMNPRPSATDPGIKQSGDKESAPFNRRNKVFSMEEALGRGESVKQIESKYNELTQALWSVLSSYYSAGEEELQGKNPVEESYNNIDFFVKELENLFELTYKKEEQQQDAQMPGDNTQSPGAKAPANYSRGSNKLVTFTRRIK
jgi:hypothetical protein